MDGFAARLNASEGNYFRSEQRSTIERHIQKLVGLGKLPESALSALKEATTAATGYQSIPVTIINSRPASETIFRYNGIPVQRMPSSEAWARLGTTKVSLGRSRWSVDGASIFSVQDGKRLAQTPHKLPSAWELNRLRKVSEASIDQRVFSGMRLMPEYTPARAMLWGSVLALWGTAALVATAAKRLDIHTSDEASDKLRAVMMPLVGSTKQAMEPLKDWLHAQNASNLHSGLMPVNELARRMREKLSRRDIPKPITQ